jgi:hypothetical protein
MVKRYQIISYKTSSKHYACRKAKVMTDHIVNVVEKPPEPYAAGGVWGLQNQFDSLMYGSQNGSSDSTWDNVSLGEGFVFSGEI